MMTFPCRCDAFIWLFGCLAHSQIRCHSSPECVLPATPSAYKWYGRQSGRGLKLTAYTSTEQINTQTHWLLIGRFAFDTKWNILWYSEKRRDRQWILQFLWHCCIQSEACKRLQRIGATISQTLILTVASASVAEIQMKSFQSQSHYTDWTTIRP